MKAGQKSYIPGIGEIRIVEVTPLTMDDLTDADAVADGFDSLNTLLDEIRTIYADKLELGYSAYRVVFALPDEASSKAQ